MELIFELFYIGLIIVGVISIILFIGMMIIVIKDTLTNRRKNKKSPILTENASVIHKRIHTSYSRVKNRTSRSDSLYVTFSFDDGRRIEFPVVPYEYMRLIKGSFGRLTYQGTKYRSFEKIG